MSTSPRQFVSMARHVRVKQLVQRARLRAQSAWETRNQDRMRRALRERIGTPQLRDVLPIAAVSPSGPKASVEDDQLKLSALGYSASMALPIDWASLGTDPDRQAWRMELHQQLYLDQLSNDDIGRLVPQWVAANPPYAPGAWRDAWNSNAISIRIITWLDVLAKRPDLPQDLSEVMTRSLVEQLLYLEQHLERDIGGNHFLRNVRALIWGGACIDSVHSDRWSDRGEGFLEQQLIEQFLPDGVHYERSATYHLLGVLDIITCWQLYPRGATRDALSRRLHTMILALRDLLHPDGSVSLFNDAVLNVNIDAADILAAWETLSGRSSERRRVFDLRDAGYTGLCIDDDYILWDCGRIGPDYLPAHGHGDCLAFEWSIGTQRVFVDTGVFEYVAGEKRQRSRSTVAHNTVTVDDEDQCEFFGAFRVGRRLNILEREVTLHDDGFDGMGVHDGFLHLAGAPTHRRRFRARPRHVRIDDTIEGGAGQMATARLLVHPDVRVTIESNTAIVTVGKHTITLTASAPLRTEPAPWYPDLGTELTTVQIVCDYGPAPARGWLEMRR